MYSWEYLTYLLWYDERMERSCKRGEEWQGDTQRNNLLLPLWLYVWNGGIEVLVVATIQACHPVGCGFPNPQPFASNFFYFPGYNFSAWSFRFFTESTTRDWNACNLFMWFVCWLNQHDPVLWARRARVYRIYTPVISTWIDMRAV